MKTIVLQIEDKTFAGLRRRVQTRAMTGDEDLLCLAWIKVFRAMESGDERVTLHAKKEMV